MGKPQGLSAFDKHQLKIAKDTLRLNDVGVSVLGGMTKEQARSYLYEVAAWSRAKIKKWEDG